MANVVFLVLVVGSLAGAEALYQLLRWIAVRKSDELRRRLRAVGLPEYGVQLLRRRHLARSKVLDKALASSGAMQRIGALIEQADLEWTVARFLTYSACYGLLGAMVGLLLLKSLPFALLLGVPSGFVPLAGVLSARRRRSQRISEQLPEALEMVARSIRAGHALATSFQLVAQEMAPPIAVEFGKAFEQQNLGLAFEDAVVQMAERVPGNTDLAIFAVSVIIQRETGGNLVETLERIADTIRSRERFYGRLRALTAEGRLSAWVLGALPFVVALLLVALNREYVLELTREGGRYVLATGIALWAIGVFWLRRMARVEY